MADRDSDIWELKQAAKWSLDLSERMKAIEQLQVNFGEQAFEALSEIKETAVHDEIRAYCIEALKNAGRASARETVEIAGDLPLTDTATKQQGPKPATKRRQAKKKLSRVRKSQKA